MAIYKNNRIVIDLTELVECRVKVTGQELSEYEEIISISKWLLDDEEDFIIKKYL